MRILTTAALATLVLLTGCASQVTVRYASEPPGATLYSGGQPVGTLPRTLAYTPDEAFKNGGCMAVPGPTAVWPSGARTQVETLRLCAQSGTTQGMTLARPDVPGREIDVHHAVELQRNAILQQQADAASQAARALAERRRAAPECRTRETVRTQQQQVGPGRSQTVTRTRSSSVCR